jgi:hypothetical protein
MDSPLGGSLSRMAMRGKQRQAEADQEDDRPWRSSRDSSKHRQVIRNKERQTEKMASLEKSQGEEDWQRFERRAVYCASLKL